MGHRRFRGRGAEPTLDGDREKTLIYGMLGVAA